MVRDRWQEAETVCGGFHHPVMLRIAQSLASPDATVEPKTREAWGGEAASIYLAALRCPALVAAKLQQLDWPNDPSPGKLSQESGVFTAGRGRVFSRTCPGKVFRCVCYSTRESTSARPTGVRDASLPNIYMELWFATRAAAAVPARLSLGARCGVDVCVA